MSSREHLKAEHQACHEKMRAAVEQLHKIEQYTLVGIGAVYAWYAAFINSPEGKSPPDIGAVSNFVLWIPFLMAVLGTARGAMQRQYMGSLATYLRSVEVALFAGDEIEGWENWFAKNRKTAINWIFRLILWPGLVLFTAFVAVQSSAFKFEY